MSKKYYVVKVGKERGIYDTWEECEKQVKGYKGAIFKSFTNEVDAQRYLNGENIEIPISRPTDKTEMNIFVDGSFKNGVVGSGVYIQTSDMDIEIAGCCDSCIGIESRNIVGELVATLLGVQTAEYLGKETVNIIYDFKGIEDWYWETWKSKKELSHMYYDLMQKLSSDLTFMFMKVKGHTNVKGNEMADKLARTGIDRKLFLNFNEILKGNYEITESSFYNKKLV